MRKPTFLRLGTSLLALICLTAPAQAASWTIIDDESTITLDGTINKGARRVTLPAFSGAIDFDKDDLAASSVDIAINIAELSDDLPEAVKTLHDSQWFNLAGFAMATFRATNIEALDDGNYSANGELTIKDTTSPIALVFGFSEYGPDPDNPEQLKAIMTGTAPLNRLDFGVGNGWNEAFPAYKIGEDVTVKVTLAATSPLSPDITAPSEGTETESTAE